MEANNMKDMREALEKMCNLFDRGAICTSYANTAEEMEQIDELYHMAKAALAEPPRNCDVYTHDEALEVWAAENEKERNGCFDEWLYHTATDTGGGAE